MLNKSLIDQILRDEGVEPEKDQNATMMEREKIFPYLDVVSPGETVWAQESSTERSCVDLIERSAKIMTGKNAHHDVTRSHEALHARFSPSDIVDSFGEIEAEIRCVEEVRIDRIGAALDINMKPGGLNKKQNEELAVSAAILLAENQLTPYVVGGALVSVRGQGKSYEVFRHQIEDMATNPAVRPDAAERAKKALEICDRVADAVGEPEPTLFGKAYLPFDKTIEGARVLHSYIEHLSKEEQKKQQDMLMGKTKERCQTAAQAGKGGKPVSGNYKSDRDGRDWYIDTPGASPKISYNKDMWGVMLVQEPPRIRRMRPKNQKGEYYISVESGIVPTRIHNWWSNKRVFGYKKKSRVPGGTIVLDASGSMALSKEDIMHLINAAPAATIAAYDGTDNYGILRVFVKGGMCIREELIHHPLGTGGNTVDGPALAWLAKQKRPRYWISDKEVVGRHGYSYSGLRDECNKICKTFNIYAIRDIGQCIELISAVATKLKEAS